MDCQDKLGQNTMRKRDRERAETFLLHEKVPGLIMIEILFKGNQPYVHWLATFLK